MQGWILLRSVIVCLLFHVQCRLGDQLRQRVERRGAICVAQCAHTSRGGAEAGGSSAAVARRPSCVVLRPAVSRRPKESLDEVAGV